ncbi:hypothetical protein PQE68_gp030 [Bacillus phage vB_BanS_Sophrita]|uniref:Uncharacterized protein n=1 Tax=Bacillus phage vB_BanS_Sophrita TaxID=2894790 RepID=A0AAE8YV76_9CAUD|nr:hypothetical protein PQE68_gp030 [Bacillus phage vB_BanS_Sophrita]UGO50621.1 hypothetical protein SOPHRITA_30 [Bacillus phage vB_BanS_Sophrita]
MTSMIQCIKDVPFGTTRHLFYFCKGKTYVSYIKDDELYAWDEQGNAHGVKFEDDDSWFNAHFIDIDTPVEALTKEEQIQFHISHTQVKIQEVKSEINILESDWKKVQHEGAKESIEERIDELRKSLIQLTAKLLDLHVNE